MFDDADPVVPSTGAGTHLRGFAEVVRWETGESGSILGVAEHRGTTRLIPRFVENSRKLQALCRKLNTEAARRSPEIDGYTLWLLQDYWKGGQGLLNQFYEPKSIGADEHLTRNAETVVLLVRDGCEAAAGRTIDATAVVSHFGKANLQVP